MESHRGVKIRKYLFNEDSLIKANEMHYFTNLFYLRTLHVWTDLLSITRSLNTAYTAIGISHTSDAVC